MFRFVKWAILATVWPFFAIAQLQLSHPMPRLVIQRGADANGRLYLSGRFTGSVDRVEAQLTPVTEGQGVATSWQTVQTNPANNLFLGYITGAGGWYVLTVRTLVDNTVLEQVSVQPVGIGEVFITAGQSNARGIGIGDNDLGTNTDRVNAIDTINHYYPQPPAAPALLSSGDPSPVPRYKALTAGQRIFPMAESSWVWGELGDYIVQRYNVPVAFYVAGWDGSTIDNWQKTANGIPACNAYYCVANWQNLQPYTNLKNVLNYYGSIGGVRAVLWQQGEAENDVASADIPQYATRLKDVILKSRQDFGGRTIPWMVARASFNGTSTTPAVVAQQENLIATPGLNVFQGPLNDTIQNRNAGTVNVHFRNASRPSPHPQYYLNTNPIPVNMGLSRFARNWNNSLNDTFFQNAQPITPTQFAATGNLANYVLPGSTLTVSFSTLGTFDAGYQWQVQLLDSLGQYISVLGSGSASPIAVALPASLQSGHFMVRVVATSPVLPAVPSNLFMITNQADVSLTMDVDQRVPDQNTPVIISLFVHNNGPGPARNVVVRNRLPANLAFVSASDFSASGTVLTGKTLELAPGTTQTLTFIAQPTASGTYQNAAEIASATTIDPDSQPNSGTGDGQDDAAQLDFRTREESPALYSSPNPNQTPLAGVSPNQPAPDPAQADVSVSMWVDKRTPRVGDIITYSLLIANQGGLSATGLSVTAYLPDGQAFIPGDDFGLSGGYLVSSVSSLAVGNSVLLRFRASATAVGEGNCTAQLTTASTSDPDSVPGNGTANGEDDTAQVDIRIQ